MFILTSYLKKLNDVTAGRLVRLAQELVFAGDVLAENFNNLLSRMFNICGDVLPDKLSQKLNDATAGRLVMLPGGILDLYHRSDIIGSVLVDKLKDVTCYSLV